MSGILSVINRFFNEHHCLTIIIINDIDVCEESICDLNVEWILLQCVCANVRVRLRVYRCACTRAPEHVCTCMWKDIIISFKVNVVHSLYKYQQRPDNDH